MARLAAFISAGKELDQAIERVQLVERLGYEAVFDTHIAGRDGLMLLAAYGQATSTIKLGTGVLPCFPRHPVSLGVEAATLDEILGGRLILGIGPSHQITMETWYGIPMEKPLTRMKEYVDVLRQLFTNGFASINGEFYNSTFGFMGYKARPDIPIMVSALAPNMLRWAGEKTEGTILWGCLPSYIEKVVAPTMNEGGRNVDIVAAIPTAVTTNVSAAYEKFRGEFFTYMMLPFYRRAIEGAGYGDEIRAFDEANGKGDRDGALKAISERMLAEFTAIGTEDDVRKKIEEYRSAGVTLPSIGAFDAGDGWAGYEATYRAAMR
jgi:alkanesulfonate monooxygenase SsuD/methylene tetrahydromethanopterin reductase-like flavin-dependent oxidoreductase (luciferase family)